MQVPAWLLHSNFRKFLLSGLKYEILRNKMVVCAEIMIYKENVAIVSSHFNIFELFYKFLFNLDWNKIVAWSFFCFLSHCL
jgi:hypothetical protein